MHASVRSTHHRIDVPGCLIPRLDGAILSQAWKGDTIGQGSHVSSTKDEATVKRYHYDSQCRLRTHLADFMAAYNFERRLKTLSGLRPYE